MPLHKRFLDNSQSNTRITDDAKTAVGVAVVYQSPSKVMPMTGGRKFREVIVAGCFERHLKQTPEIICTIAHETALVLGRTSRGSLRLRDSPQGLVTECDLPDTSYARDLRENIKNGNIAGMSFTFKDVREEWEEPKTREDVLTCYVYEGEIHEVCFTPVPAYEDTTASLREFDPRRLKNSNQKLRSKLMRSVLVQRLTGKK